MVPLSVETWIWWTFVIICVICRLISRVQSLGSIKRLQSDDYITLVAVVFYTILIVSINLVAHNDSNLLPPGFDLRTLTPDAIKDRAYGSKLVLVVEQSQIMTVWAEKACLLILYQRLTVGRTERLCIKMLFVYVAASWLVMEVLYLGVWCRPFNMYWAVPTTTQCSAATNHLITNAIFNISSDIMILCIALPMFIKTRLPLRKKVAIVGIFSLGSFVIICAILNKVYSFNQPFGLDWTFWYVRESSTAILTANAAFVWALIRRTFRLRSLGSISGKRVGYSNGYMPTYTTNQTRVETLRKKPRHHEFDLDLLMPDPDDEGIHREIEIKVTQGRRESFMSGNTHQQAGPVWAEAWAVKSPNGSREGSSHGDTATLTRRSESGSEVSINPPSPPQKPLKALLRSGQGTPPP